mgnify:CR=1 FL=1
MLPHQRENSPFRSKPVSRVTSSTRLNQLAQESRGPLGNSSRPSTPGTYVPSSLNPLKYAPNTQDNIEDKIRSNEELAAFNLLPIVAKIGGFREALDTLSNGISHYKEDEFYTNMERIIETNTSLEKEVHELSKHKERSQELVRLSNLNKEFETKSKDYLKTLVQLRNDLKRLPSTADTDSELENLKSPVDVESILNYSMKLAKFTKAPTAVGNLSYQIHPNNYTWPAEDSLRRGMLAMSSLHANEIIKSELLEGEDAALDEKEGENVEHQSVETNKDQLHTKKDHIPKETQNSVKTESASQVDLDLDLFDPEDEYSD